MGRNESELANFEDAVKQILSVSHEEIKKRESSWKRDRLKKKKKEKKK